MIVLILRPIFRSLSLFFWFLHGILVLVRQLCCLRNTKPKLARAFTPYLLREEERKVRTECAKALDFKGLLR